MNAVTGRWARAGAMVIGGMLLWGACRPATPPSDAGGLEGRGGSLGPVGDTAPLALPADHLVDWTWRHAHEARTRGQDCMSCHTEASCTDCHDARLSRPFSVHPPNFVAVHARESRQTSAACTSCHAPVDFCATCHVPARVHAPAAPGVARDARGQTVDTGRLEPPAGRGIHPTWWLDASHPNHHGHMARMQIETCASCHAPSDCVSCHAGVNPHGPGFADQCRSWLQASPASCANCHASALELARRCR